MRRVLVIIVGLAFMVGACGDDSGGDATATTDGQNAEEPSDESDGLSEEAVGDIEVGILGLVGDTYPDLSGQVASVQLEGTDLTVEISNLDDPTTSVAVCQTVSDFAAAEGAVDVVTTILASSDDSTLAETGSDGVCVPG